MKKSFNIQELLHSKSKHHGTKPMLHPSSSSSRAFQRHQEHNLKHPPSVDLIPSKQNKLPSFIDRFFFVLFNPCTCKDLGGSHSMTWYVELCFKVHYSFFYAIYPLQSCIFVYIYRKILNSHLFWLNSHPAHLNQVLDMPDVQVQEPLVVVKKRSKVWI